MYSPPTKDPARCANSTIIPIVACAHTTRIATLFPQQQQPIQAVKIAHGDPHGRGRHQPSRLPGSQCTFPTRANLSRSTPRLCTSTGTLFFPTHVHRICSDVAALRRAIVQRTQILKNFRSSCRESMDTVSSCRKHRPRQHYRPRLRTHASATDHPMPMACTLDAAISPIVHAQRPSPASPTSVDGSISSCPHRMSPFFHARTSQTARNDGRREKLRDS